MKMSLSGWFQRGRKKARSPEAPAAGSQATTATVGWMDSEGVAHAAKAKLGERFEGGIDLSLKEEITVDTRLWLISEDGFDRAATVHFCGEEQGRFTVRVAFLDDVSESEALGDLSNARMKWTEGSGRIVECAVSFRNSESGELTVSMTEALPVPSIVLLTGGDYQCLGSVRACEEEADCWVSEVVVMSDAYPRARAQAA